VKAVREGVSCIAWLGAFVIWWSNLNEYAMLPREGQDIISDRGRRNTKWMRSAKLTPALISPREMSPGAPLHKALFQDGDADSSSIRVFEIRNCERRGQRSEKQKAPTTGAFPAKHHIVSCWRVGSRD
jgi:hypothetical protein